MTPQSDALLRGNSPGNIRMYEGPPRKSSPIAACKISLRLTRSGQASQAKHAIAGSQGPKAPPCDQQVRAICLLVLATDPSGLASSAKPLLPADFQVLHSTN